MEKKIVKEENPYYIWDAEHMVEMADVVKSQCCFWNMWTIDPDIGKKNDCSPSLKPNIQRLIKIWSN